MDYVCGLEHDNYSFSIRLDKTKPTGIMISGGLDSAILLMLLGTLTQSNQIVTFTVPRPDNAVVHAENLIKSINHEYGLNFNLPCHVGDGLGPHGKQVYNGIQEAIAMYGQIDLYLAENKPPKKTEVTFEAAYPLRASTPNQIPQVTMPFWSAKKFHIIDLALKHGWHRLFEFTHSCCVWPKYRCKKCYNCLEREWAFAKLDYKDTGVL